MEQIKENKMGTAPMFKLILSMSLPAMFSMLVQAMYNVVDGIFVAQYSNDAMTAVSIAFPLQMLIISVAVGTGIGINSLVSRRLGEKKQEEADKAASHGIFLGIVTGAAFILFLGALTGVFFLLKNYAPNVLYKVLSDDPEIIEMTTTYLAIVLGISMPIFVQINIEKTLQATGDMFYPMVIQLTGAITNIILDPIMIFGLFGFPKMGVAGAAVATVTGQILSLIFSLIVIFKKKDHKVTVRIRGFKFDKAILREIYRVGFPSMIMQSIGSVLNFCLNLILIRFSNDAVFVLGAYYKLQSFVFMPVFGLTHGLMPIMGFNFGARNKERMKSSIKYGMMIAVTIMTVGLLIFELIPQLLLQIFNPSAEIISIGTVAFRLIALCFIPAAIGITASTLFQALGMGTKSLWVSILRQLVLILPLAYFFSNFGLNYVWLAFPLAESIALIVACIFLVGIYKKYIKVMPDKK